MRLDGDNQMGDVNLGDIAETVNRISVVTTDNRLLLSEMLRRLDRLEHRAAIRTHIIASNAVVTVVIAAVMLVSYRRNLRGALGRRA